MPRRSGTYGDVLKGRFSMSKQMGGEEGHDHVILRIEDEASDTLAMEVRIPLLEFAQAQFGLYGVKCQFEMNQDGPVGYKHENKSEIIPVPDFPYGDKEKLDAVADLVKGLEVDGWMAMRRDFGNRHNYRYFKKSVEGMTKGIVVTLHRYIHPETGEPWKSPSS